MLQPDLTHHKFPRVSERDWEDVTGLLPVKARESKER